ncbi:MULTISPECIES: hypothetical protein [unclassified Streptomyces]|uniref:hypothetical protein n=1 Tax=unclassified Streptomyces TaxID=2593676 RepID=UPI00224EBD30|nr:MULTISPECIES: hypothetical protein [unclassified Streptomyces]MCX4629285.1 hypothetical protein [Streptomyces sp. NBC_01443]WSW45302.1 hypothetical protein OG296_20465 [Streptomyces sp. NBC_01001]
MHNGGSRASGASGTGAIRGRRRGGAIRRMAVALLVACTAVACGPAESGGPAVSLPPSPSLSVSASPTPSPSPTPTPSPSATPTPAATTAEPPAQTPDAKPAPTRTLSSGSSGSTGGSGSAPKPPATKAPTKEATPPAGGTCEIVSNAGNCYKAGQFCRKADLGRSTHAENGRLIHCRLDGSQPRWQY